MSEFDLFGTPPTSEPEPVRKPPRKAPAQAAPKPKKLTAKQQRLAAPEPKRLTVEENETHKAVRLLAEMGILHPDEIKKHPEIFADRMSPELKRDLTNWRERHANRHPHSGDR